VIQFDQLQQQVLGVVQTNPPENLVLGDCVGAVLAEPILATVDLPPFDNSAMDGYAVRAADIAILPASLRVVGVSSAGHPADCTVGIAEAARILTGAVMVQGADTVVRVEDTEPAENAQASDARSEFVVITAAPAPGANIRRAGEAARTGDELVASGTLLNPGHLGLAASAGCSELMVIERPRVAVLSTGDELLPPGAGQLGPGQIFESNSTVLTALARSMGCEVTTHHCMDDAASLRTLLMELAGSHQLILSSGGVSMGGEYDSMRQAVAGFDVEFLKIAIRPAKPIAFGKIQDSILFGLPGNPVSSVVAFELFVRPAIRQISGLAPALPPMLHGVAGEQLPRLAGEFTYMLSTRQDSQGAWVSTGGFGSHVLGGIAHAQALAVIPPGPEPVAKGSDLHLIPLWS
jgi:molybdopterin molybdotransferase